MPNFCLNRIKKISVTKFTVLFLQTKPFSSKLIFLNFFFKTIFGNPFLDIYKCPFLIFGNTFGKIILVFLNSVKR